MKILFCSPNPLTKSLGAPKVLIELAENLEIFGWDCKLVGPSDVLGYEVITKSAFWKQYPVALRRYLLHHSAKYDVVDYDYAYLPFSRDEFPRKPLFVARSVLLAHHFLNIQIPQTVGSLSLKKNFKSKVRALVFGPYYKKQLRDRAERCHRTIDQSDIVVVLNFSDKEVLVDRGIPSQKIYVVPSGISDERRKIFDKVSEYPTNLNRIVFVGTFDNRKGANEMPLIFEKISEIKPDSKLRLLGSLGLYKTKAEILSCFPDYLRNRVEVVESFEPLELPKLLADCSVGIFPSYIEGFPFGVLEMLAASLPVIAYDSPGPPMMLDKEYLVPIGDYLSLSYKVNTLLTNPETLLSARIWAKNRSKEFSWEKSASIMDQIYRSNLAL